MKIRAVLLDLDNTLFNTDNAYEKALLQVGLSLTAPPYIDARRLVKSRLGPGHVSARNRLLYFKALLEAENRLSPTRLLDTMEIYEKALHEEIARQWEATQRAALLKNLQKNCVVCLITNENLKTQMVKLRAIDPDGTLLPKVLVSEEVGAEKPDWRIFQEALRRLGSFDKEEIVMIGDSIEADITPALNFGMNAILTQEYWPQKVETPVQKNLRVVHSFEEAISCIET